LKERKFVQMSAQGIRVSRFDGLKWLVVAALVAVAVVGNSYFSNESLLYRVLAIVAIAAVAGFVALQTAKGASFWTLVKGSRTEIRKVVWPTRQETVQTTMIVVAFRSRRCVDFVGVLTHSWDG
jgi:preprotein translocase subunit SecE